MIPFCTPAQVAASILRSGPVSDSDYGQTAIALINRSKTSCTVPAFPKLVFERDGKALTVTIRPGSFNHSLRTVALQPSSSATLSFIWPRPPELVQAMGSKCSSSADLWINLHSGLPLYVPTNLTVCGNLEQDALSGPPLPSDYDASVAYATWIGQQGCDSWFRSLLKDSRSAMPRASDSLDMYALVTKHGTSFFGAEPPGVTEHTGMSADAPTVLYDPDREAIASIYYFGGDESSNNSLCTAVRSIPYGIAMGSVAAVATKRGVAIGTTQAATVELDGPAPVIDLGGSYSAMHYQWKDKAGAYNLIYLFYKSRVIAMDYWKVPNA